MSDEPQTPEMDPPGLAGLDMDAPAPMAGADMGVGMGADMGVGMDAGMGADMGAGMGAEMGGSGGAAPAAPDLGVPAVPVEVMISVGKARPTVTELVALRRDSVLPLDSRLEDPVELYAGGKLIARGELVELDGAEGRLGVRLTDVADQEGPR